MGIIAPIPVANGGNRYEATMSISEELQRQNDRLELLLNLTSKITSSLDLREVLRAVAANIREVIHAEGVTVSLQDAASEKFRVRKSTKDRQVFCAPTRVEFCCAAGS